LRISGIRDELVSGTYYPMSNRKKEIPISSTHVLQMIW